MGRCFDSRAAAAVPPAPWGGSYGDALDGCSPGCSFFSGPVRARGHAGGRDRAVAPVAAVAPMRRRAGREPSTRPRRARRAPLTALERDGGRIIRAAWCESSTATLCLRGRTLPLPISTLGSPRQMPEESALAAEPRHRLMDCSRRGLRLHSLPSGRDEDSTGKLRVVTRNGRSIVTCWWRRSARTWTGGGRLVRLSEAVRVPPNSDWRRSEDKEKAPREAEARGITRS